MYKQFEFRLLNDYNSISQIYLLKPDTESESWIFLDNVFHKVILVCEKVATQDTLIQITTCKKAGHYLFLLCQVANQ